MHWFPWTALKGADLLVIVRAQLLEHVRGRLAGQRGVQVGDALERGQAADRHGQLGRLAVGADRRHRLAQKARQLAAAARAAHHCGGSAHRRGWSTHPHVTCTEGTGKRALPCQCSRCPSCSPLWGQRAQERMVYTPARDMYRGDGQESTALPGQPLPELLTAAAAAHARKRHAGDNAWGQIQEQCLEQLFAI